MIKQYFYLFCFFMSFTQLICMDLEIDLEVAPKIFSIVPLELIPNFIPNLQTAGALSSTCKKLSQKYLADEYLSYNLSNNTELISSSKQYTLALVHYAQKYSLYDQNNNKEKAETTRKIFVKLACHKNTDNKAALISTLNCLDYDNQKDRVQQAINCYLGRGTNIHTDYLYKAIKEDDYLVSLVILFNDSEKAVKVSYSGNITPLIYAVCNASYLCISTLLKYSKKVINHQDLLGNTALHYACEKNLSKDIISLFIQQGCKINIKNNSNKSPLSLTKNKGIKELLLSASRPIPLKRKQPDPEQDNSKESTTKRTKR